MFIYLGVSGNWQHTAISDLKRSFWAFMKKGNDIMDVVVSCCVDKDLYYASDTRHAVSLIATEYVYRNEMLVRLHIGKNLCICLNNRLRDEVKSTVALSNEQFFVKKMYHLGNAKPITRGTFDEKLKRFDMSKTAVEMEILEEYSCIGKDGCVEGVQIVIKEKSGTMTAEINFKSAEQHQNFITPPWLTAKSITILPSVPESNKNRSITAQD